MRAFRRREKSAPQHYKYPPLVDSSADFKMMWYMINRPDFYIFWA
jgi:hypothetical protein